MYIYFQSTCINTHREIAHPISKFYLTPQNELRPYDSIENYSLYCGLTHYDSYLRNCSIIVNYLNLITTLKCFEATNMLESDHILSISIKDFYIKIVL